jgi:ZIP family zinc transporter
LLLALLVFITTLSTFLGGLFALWHQHKLHKILGFTAGVLLGVVAFDVFPEIFHLVHAHNIAPIAPMIAFVVGFLAFHVLEKLTIIHHMHEDEYAVHNHPQVGVLSALALIGHSFADGLGIGLGFQVSTEAGVLVALAVIAHDFSDGLNTVSLVLTSNNTARRARLLLACDALAPVCGAASTLLFTLPEHVLVLYLGVFAGFLMYIGASDILPQAHSQHSSVSTIMLTLFGALFIFILTRFT